MQTRRTTRRSLAAAELGVENDLSSRTSSRQTTNSNSTTSNNAAGPSKPQVAVIQKPVVRRTALTGKSVLGDKTSTASNATRKRSAFSDVTNGSKAKSEAAGGKVVVATAESKPAAASTSTVRRAYRTRSSTGGGTSAIKEEPLEPKQEDQEEEDEEEVEEGGGGESDAMAIDQVVEAPVQQEESKPRITTRQTKPLKRSASALSNNGPTAAADSKSTAAATRRPALAQKRTNTFTGAATRNAKGSSKTVGKTTPQAVRAARRRREAAEAKHLAALAELEEAKRQEEQELEQHRSKKLKTSEPEMMLKGEEEEEEEVVDEDEEQEEEDELAEEEERRVNAKYEVEVEGARAKDEGWEDLDAGDEEDPLMVSAYVVEVYEYLRELELTTMPDPEYMVIQNEVTWKMRGILVDWLVEIHTKFRLLPETIFLAVNIIDRFLSTRAVSLVKFQLVGVTALFIAAKYEEVVCPSVSNFLYMTDGGYSDEEILKAERYVLGIIGFNLSYPNPINFLRRISKADGYDIQSRTWAKYLMEISIVDHRFMATPPSLIAAAAAWLARRALQRGEWDANLVHYSGYSEEELKPTAQLMLEYICRTSPVLAHLLPNSEDGEDSGASNPLQMSPISHENVHPNFIKKYAAKKFFKASTSLKKWAEEIYSPITTKRKVDGKFVVIQPAFVI
ncbi:cyclin family protein [Sporobolomyces salmoneus]|uniref:cyclin family protein n=1 Tax=Sporobolomyces salmoneus TaxID=183962 RepID=UPI0031751C97